MKRNQMNQSRAITMSELHGMTASQIKREVRNRPLSKTVCFFGTVGLIGVGCFVGTAASGFAAISGTVPTYETIDVDMSPMYGMSLLAVEIRAAFAVVSRGIALIR